LKFWVLFSFKSGMKSKKGVIGPYSKREWS